MKSVVVALVAVVVYLYTVPLPQPIEPSSYSITLPKKFDGPLAVNDKLEKAEHLHENSLQWPEAFAVYQNKIYTGLGDGRIVQITDKKIIDVVRTGEKCGGQFEEHICGRPLGMAFDKEGLLYVADGYLGLFTINVKTGKKSNILPSKTLVDGLPLTFLNDLTLDEKERAIYFTQSSTKWTLNQAAHSIIDHDFSGRLLKYDLKTKVVTVLLDKLELPNGVTFTHDGQALLFAKGSSNRIVKYYVRGAGKKGSSEVLPLELPGHPDNITPNKRGNYWVAIEAARTQENPILLDRLSDKPLVRKIMLHCHRLCPFVKAMLAIPHKAVKEAGFELETLRMLVDFMPTHGMIIEFDDSGNILRSFHSPNGKMTHISEVLELDGYLYLGSWRNRFVGRLKL